MGRDVAGEWESADRVFDIADRCTGLPVRRLCFEGPANELVMTVNLQPCVVAASIAMLAAACEDAGLGQPESFDLRQFPQPPAFAAGHSVGEYSALVASGALSVSDCLELVAFRGRAMDEAGRRRPGTMLALLSGSTDAAIRLCGDIRESVDGSYLDIANYNSPEQVVVAGDLESVALAGRRAADYGFRRALPLPVSGAFHSSAMLPASEKMVERLLSAELAEPRIPVVGNIDAEPIPDPDSIRGELSAQIVAPVRWAESMSYMGSRGAQYFVEVGPGQVLSRLATRAVEGAEALAVGDVEGVRALAGRFLGQ
jgi:[acyl-carrier-protein] S-malonyltransferase